MLGTRTPGRSTAPAGTASPARAAAGEGPDVPVPLRGRRRSVEAAQPLPLQRLVARIWPAVALGPVETLLAALQPQSGAAMPAPASALLPLLVAGLRTAAGASPDAVSPGESARSASAQAPTDSFAGDWIPADGELPLLVALAAGAALMATLALTIGRELRSMTAYRRHP